MYGRFKAKLLRLVSVIQHISWCFALLVLARTGNGETVQIGILP
jgi:hypothetical protein